MTKIERLSPELKALAEKLGYQIHYRAKAYWAGSDIQLTYEVYKGQMLSTLEDKIPYALSILKNIEEQRNKQRPIAERIKELIESFNQVQYFPNNVFTEMRTQEVDQLTVLNWNGTLTAWLDIIGEPKIEYKDYYNKESLNVSLNATLKSYKVK